MKGFPHNCVRGGKFPYLYSFCCAKIRRCADAAGALVVTRFSPECVLCGKFPCYNMEIFRLIILLAHTTLEVA